MRPIYNVALAIVAALSLGLDARASSHREAPLISNDPLADNTDLYAFRSPDDPSTITIIANYIPFELPEGGPNWYSFGENVRYEIHVENDGVADEDIIYRFTFTKTNEDPTTFFNIRLGKQNLKTTYVAEKSVDGGQTFATIVANGVVPPPNIGPRSIESGVGLNATGGYMSLMQDAITPASGNGGETIFCGPVDDPFFVDLGGIFDLGAVRMPGDTGAMAPRDGLAGFNTHAIALKIPIASLQKSGKEVGAAASILDPEFVIGVWASASRPKVTTLGDNGAAPQTSGPWVQVSRLGMPLTNEAIIPVGDKDRWNSSTPYDRAAEESYEKYFTNPELALYMDDSRFGGAVPGLMKLRIQAASLGQFDFRNEKMGLKGLPNSARANTALADEAFGGFLLRDAAPRSVDLLPIFYTGVPNLPPYQLATGKAGNPLAAGKPFIHNFLPTLGDMLRLNMATPVTARTSTDFSSLGIVSAAVLGLTDARFNASTDLQPIPNMDGFPNGRRLEDDVTRIELQAVGGVALAAIGLWYDDYTAGGANPVTPHLLNVLGFTAGPTANDVPFRAEWPYLAPPHRGYDYVRPDITSAIGDEDPTGSALGLSARDGFFVGQNFPNPTTGETTFRYHLRNGGDVAITLFNARGEAVATIEAGRRDAGRHTVRWAPPAGLEAGAYVADLRVGGRSAGSMKLTIVR
jgi:hypothetical protein